MAYTREFDSVVEMYGGEIFAYLWRVLGGYQDAEDCLQDVFLRAFKAFGRLNRESNVRAWLYKIATNTSISYLRKRKRTESQEVIVDYDLMSTDPSPDDRMELKERFVKLLKVIDELPNRQRTSLILRKYQELSYFEISEILGCSQEAARANVYQAMKKLRDRYSKGHDGLE